MFRTPQKEAVRQVREVVAKLRMEHYTDTNKEAMEEYKTGKGKVAETG